MVTANLYQAGVVDYSFPFPQSWNEFTTPQLQAVANAFFISIKEESEAKAAVLFSLLDMHRKKLPPNTIKKIHIDDLSTVGNDLLQFIWEDNTLSKQPYPSIRLGLKKMYGPDNDFDNLTCGEFEQAEISINQFLREKDIKHLATLAAILFRPKAFSWFQYKRKKLYTYSRKRNEYEPYPYEKMVQHFLKLQPEILYTIYLWYCGCRNLLVKYFPHVYSGSGTGTPDILVFTKCIHAAAGDKNGTRQHVRLLLVKELHFEMEQEAIAAKKMEEAYATK